MYKAEKEHIDEAPKDKPTHDFDTSIDTLENRSGETIILSSEHIKDHYKLKDLNNCEIIIHAIYKTLYLENIKSCRIYSGVVENSVFGKNIVDSTIDCIAQQIRIHEAKDTNFNVFVISNMIIEDSKGLKIREWKPNDSEIGKLFNQCLFKGKINNWADVKDFNWIKVIQSPNFEIINE